jgi:hypothetical protein
VCGTLENLSIRWKELDDFIDNDYTWTFHDFMSLTNLFISYRLIFGPQPVHADITSEAFPPTLKVLGMYPSQPDSSREDPEDEWEEQDYVGCFETLLHKKDSIHLPNLPLIAHLDRPSLLETFIDLAASRGVQVALRQADLTSLPI